MRLVHFIGFFTLLMMCVTTQAQTNKDVFEKKQRPLTIAVNKTTYPYMFMNEQGKADGLLPELWRLWAERQNVEVEFITSDWLTTLSRVKSGEVDINNVPCRFFCI